MVEYGMHDHDSANPHRGPFIFVGDRLALDLVNTRLHAPAPPTELLRDEIDLASWAEAAALPYADALRQQLDASPPPLRATIVSDVKMLREAIHEGIEQWTTGQLDPRNVDAINRALARAPRYLQLRTGRGGITGELVASAPAIDRLFADVARSAAQLIRSTTPKRVKHCEGPTCSLVFYDGSKPGTRRWCSMALCGRDAKVRALRSRRRR